MLCTVTEHVVYAEYLRLVVENHACVRCYRHLARCECVEGIDGLVRRYIVREMYHDVDLVGGQDAVFNFGLTGHQKDHVRAGDVDLAGAMVFQTGETGVDAVAVADLNGHAAVGFFGKLLEDVQIRTKKIENKLKYLKCKNNDVEIV